MAHILVLDDVAEAGVMIQKILGKKGHEVAAFSDEDEALAHAGRHRLDLAILDLMLKKTSGLEVLIRMKALQPDLRTLVLTGYPTSESLRQAMELGADAYCVKPMDKDALENKVAALLAGRAAGSA